MRKILVGIFIAVIALAAWWFCSRVIIWDHSAETDGAHQFVGMENTISRLQMLLFDGGDSGQGRLG